MILFQIEVIKIDLRAEMEEKEKQVKLLQQTLQGMQQQLIEAKRKQAEEETKVKELQSKLKAQPEIVNLDDGDDVTECSIVSETTSEPTPPQPLSERDAKLVGIISTFLNVHPFGAGLDYIWSYVSKLESNLRPSDIEMLMTKFPNVFKQELMGIGADIERRWLFNVFKASSNSIK